MIVCYVCLICFCIDNWSGGHGKIRKFGFDNAFDEKASTDQVYRSTAATVIPAVLQGYNCTVFAYGATGAGKTHTMLGDETEPVCIFFVFYNCLVCFF